ncbi:MAG: potassium channel family protein, partial [Marinoscillum sp.]
MLKYFFRNKTFKLVLEILGGLLIFVGLVYLLEYVEKDSNQASIKDFQNAMWYALVTLTTVGYGDVFPATLYGRGIAYIFILMSLGIYGILIGQFTTLMATIKENKRLGLNGTNFEGHAVIIGWNEFGKMVLDQLIGVGKQVAIVTNKREDIDMIRDQYSSKYIFILYSDFQGFELLKKTNIEQSS